MSGNLQATLFTVGYGDEPLTRDAATEMIRHSTTGLLVGHAIQCDGCALWHGIVLRQPIASSVPAEVAA